MSMALNAMLDFVGFASTAAVIVLLIDALQPLFEKVRDSCRAGQPHNGRALLLWSASLIHVAWLTAAVLYWRNLFRLWERMGVWLADYPTERAVYAVLHFYLFVLLFCGVFACTVTVAEIYRNFQVYKDLFMIARFNPIQDLEAQHSSSSADPVDAEAENPSTGGNVSNTSSPTQDENSLRNGQEANGDLPAAAFVNEAGHVTENDSSEIDPPVASAITQLVYNPTQNVEEAAKTSSPFDSDGDEVWITPSSPSSSDTSSGIDELEYVDDDYDRYARRGAQLRELLEHRKKKNSTAPHTSDPREDFVYDETEFLNRPYHATPNIIPRGRNAKIDLAPLDIGEPPSPCDSCSSANAESIPTAKRSLFRVPITPTSPTADAEDADTEKTDVERNPRKQKSHF